MSDTTLTDSNFNEWATKPDGPVAIRLKQVLEPVEDSRIIFPPTYADIGYNVDTLSDGTRVATVDSVGSQANRLEPIFLSASNDAGNWLVPQVNIVIPNLRCRECEACMKNAAQGAQKKPCTQPREVTRSLLDLAHRAADAVVQSSSDLQKLVAPAIKKLQNGDAGPMCAIAPTSLVFGFWDSRGGTGEKRPRLVRSTIRAWDVEPLHSAAQFNSVWKVLDESQQEELKKEAKSKNKELSVIGFKDAPATFRKTTKVRPYHPDGSPNPEARVLGGVLVRGRIEREVVVNLVALRALRGKNADGTDATAAIRKYILGLSLVAASADIELFLREGCLLRYADTNDQWYVVPRRGEPQAVTLDPKVVEQYAHESAAHFRAKWPEVFRDRWPKDPHQAPDLKYTFSLDAAKKLISKGAPEEEATQG